MLNNSFSDQNAVQWGTQLITSGHHVLAHAGTDEVVGWQSVIDLHDCRTPLIDDLDWIRATMLEAAMRAEATIVCDKFHRFSPYGVSGVVVIAESHLAVHTWPERRYAAIDVFTCNSQLRMRDASAYLIESFQSKLPRIASLERGGPCLVKRSEPIRLRVAGLQERPE